VGDPPTDWKPDTMASRAVMETEYLYTSFTDTFVAEVVPLLADRS